MRAVFTYIGVVVGLVLAWALLMVAHADPPPGADPNSPIARWVHTLQHDWSDPGEPEWTQPGSCCSDADCRPTWARPTQLGASGGIDVWIGKDEYGWRGTDSWEPVSAETIRKTRADGPPPDGHPWACFYDHHVLCYVGEPLY